MESSENPLAAVSAESAQIAPSASHHGPTTSMEASDGSVLMAPSDGNVGEISRKRRNYNTSTELEDIMDQITSKMDSLSTGKSKDDMLSGFVAVLGVSLQMAEFFLESSAWDLQCAVSLYLENNDHDNLGFSLPAQEAAHSMAQTQYERSAINSSAPTGSLDFDLALQVQQEENQRNNSNKRSKRQKYKGRKVEIAGLPDGWEAYVSRSGGEVYFINNQTRVRQFQVPPGYADAEDDPTLPPSQSAQTEHLPPSSYSHSIEEPAEMME